ncbi:DUF6390 family protein [Nocardioides donggukensis]|uniref:Uncharacterized protein n=1 Tax=Nocardioides donggukensis TaxID=2774019 RepID=A0A927K437_9ACTN|nr:DUF6390 family protein [Nocardioides donggukensis]MBD8869451.1 hypothetical protein [Nocardioides donggukensis]
MSAEGAVLFARYAYPPNALGYCGPEGAEAMLRPAAVADIERRARQFDGAWSYLELLAEAHGSGDPLSAAVVEAYWLGSPLLDGLAPNLLVERLRERFAGQPGGTWRQAGDRARAHHSFQVFEVYPWAELLRAGRPVAPALHVLDRCRIRVGEVVAAAGEAVTVSSDRLRWDPPELTVTGPVTEEARWSVGGLSLIPAPEVGDLVALHWDWVCDTVSPRQAEHLAALERRQRRSIGRMPGV